MVKYPNEYVEFLKSKAYKVKENGVEIVIKPSPTEKRDGYLDALEKETLDRAWLANMTKNKDNEDREVNQDQSLESIVYTMRDMMGFSNLNLNTVEIYTKFETIKESGNEVGIWSYYPRNIEREKNKSALVFFHGGGWIGGTTYVVENFCKLIAERANCVVFNIDYSLAPEKPFPNGLNDNYYAVKHIYDNADKYGINKDKIAIAGDSAGGNYAAAVALKARDEKDFNVAMQVLIYPVIALADATIEGYNWCEDVFNISSEQEAQIRPMISLGRPENPEESLMTKLYLQDNKDIYNPYVSPIMAKSHKNLPKSILVAAEFDGLRVQTEFYAKLLKDSGVDVTYYCYKGMTHAFIDRLGFVPQAEDLVNIISEEIKKLN